MKPLRVQNWRLKGDLLNNGVFAYRDARNALYELAPYANVIDCPNLTSATPMGLGNQLAPGEEKLVMEINRPGIPAFSGRVEATFLHEVQEGGASQTLRECHLRMSYEPEISDGDLGMVEQIILKAGFEKVEQRQ